MSDFTRVTISGTDVLVSNNADLAVPLASPNVATVSSSESGGSLLYGLHTFVLTSLDADGGESAPGGEVAVSVQGPHAEATLTWTVDPAATGGYRVYHGTQHGGYSQYVAVGAGIGTYTWTGSGTSGGHPPQVGTGFAWRLKNSGKSLSATLDYLLDDSGAILTDGVSPLTED